MLLFQNFVSIFNFEIDHFNHSHILDSDRSVEERWFKLFGVMFIDC